MEFNTATALYYHTYNSLFLSLPFKDIEAAGTHLALFAQECEERIKAGDSPRGIVESFWEEYYKDATTEERLQKLRYFIQYIERQVVLFDSVEDSMFLETHEMNGPGSLNHFLTQIRTEKDH